MFRPGCFLFFLYALGYVALRLYGEIAHQAVQVMPQGRMAESASPLPQQHIVGAPIHLPHWRRQLYRAGYSPLMVVEEEAWQALDRAGGLGGDFIGETINKYLSK